MSNDHLPAPSCLTASEAQTLAIAVSELNRTVVDLRVSAAETAIQIRQMSDQLKEAVSDINSLQSISDQNKGEKTIIATISVFVGGIISALISWWIQK
jgi:hypothetical protein